jgi:NADH dehydrogenase FAD-containing subunit
MVLAAPSVIARFGVLLVVRIWLSQAILSHGLMAMMQAEGFSRQPSGWSMLAQGMLPLLLTVGLLTRPVALLLLLASQLGLNHALSVPQSLLLVWLLAQGAGWISLDHMVGRGLARVPVWSFRAAGWLYRVLHRISADLLPFGTRGYLATAIAAGSGSAFWPQLISSDPLTAPWWVILLGWGLIVGLLTRPICLLLCLVAPLSMLSAAGRDMTGVVLLLLLLASSGAGKLSLDWLFAKAAIDADKRPPEIGADLPRVVVVGGGFGGMATVRALRSTACHVTLIDRRNHFLFQPLLYQVATAALSPADIALPIRSVLRGQRNIGVRLGEVTGVDLDKRHVLLHDDTVPFDYLVVATGARHGYFGRDEWASVAPGLKSVEDATKMRGRLLRAFEEAESETDIESQRAWLTFVIVGGGPTGVELAGALAELARTGMEQEYHRIDPTTARVILVQSGPRLLPTFSPKSSRRAEDSLRTLGVEVLTGAKVTGIDTEGVAIDGMRIPARTSFWAAGVAASPAAQWLAQEGDRSGRVVVTESLSVPGCPHIFAVGDTAASNGWRGNNVPGLAPAARQQGKYAARVIKAAISNHSAPPPFQYRHFGNLATIGRLSAVAELPGIRLWGAPAWWAWGLAHVLFLAGGRNRMAVMLNWLWAYITYRRGTRLITASMEAEMAFQKIKPPHS